MVLGFSGGLDSTVLLHLLVRARDAGLLAPFKAVHVNHRLQPQADAWVQHAQRLADSWHVPFIGVSVDIDRSRPVGLEAAAREARYAALAGLMEEGGVLLTAHHLDDQAETFLLQLMRGAGVRGLSAMPVLMPFDKGWHVRPMLRVRRDQLMEYAEANGLIWVDDPSNADARYARNHVRHHILPSMRSHWPQAEETLARASRRMASTESLLHDLARLDLDKARTDEPHVLEAHALLQLSSERIYNALRFWLIEMGLPVPTEMRLAEIGNMLHVRPDAVPMVDWAGVAVYRWRECLYFKRKSQTLVDPGMRVHWDGRDELELPALGLRLVPSLELDVGLRLDLVQAAGLEIRLRSGGEVIRLPRQQHHKEVKHLLQEAGIPPWERETLPFIYIDNKLAQVGDRWTSADFQPDHHHEGLVVRMLPL